MKIEALNRKMNFPLKDIIIKYGTIIVGLLLIIIFAALSPKHFATISNAVNISRQISLLVVISLGATFVMSVGEFDLSIGAAASLGGVLAAILATKGVPNAVSFLLPLLAGVVIGIINGYIVTRFKVLSFVVTLGMSTILAGVTYWITGGATIFEGVPNSFKIFNNVKFLQLPLLTWVMAILVIICNFIMNNTVLGRKFYAIGGNESAAKVSGIKVNQLKTVGFILAGVFAIASGVLMSSRLGSAHPTGGDGLFLQAYAAVYIGSTVSKEGVPNILGTLVGAAILGILANGLTIMRVPTYLQDILTGAIIIGSVIFQRLGSESND